MMMHMSPHSIFHPHLNVDDYDSHNYNDVSYYSDKSYYHPSDYRFISYIYDYSSHPHL